MRRVLVTGGADGIGLAMARAFDAAGYAVWVTDVNDAALAAVPEGWRADRVDVSDAEGMAALFARIATTWRGIDVVCANAGIAGPTARVEEVGWDAWRACVDVTLGGAFLTAKHAAAMMRDQGRGSIVFTSSTAGQHGFPNRSPYAAAKWGVIGLMKTVAMELGPLGIRANAITPGAVDGPRMEGVIAREAAAKGMTPEAVRAGYTLGTSLRCFVRAEDVAALAVFLGSDAAERISGQVIAVDGHTENPDPKP